MYVELAHRRAVPGSADRFLSSFVKINSKVATCKSAELIMYRRLYIQSGPPPFVPKLDFAMVDERQSSSHGTCHHLKVIC